jgi:hypothetical protein
LLVEAARAQKLKVYAEKLKVYTEKLKDNAGYFKDCVTLFLRQAL